MVVSPAATAAVVGCPTVGGQVVAVVVVDVVVVLGLVVVVVDVKIVVVVVPVIDVAVMLVVLLFVGIAVAVDVAAVVQPFISYTITVFHELVASCDVASSKLRRVVGPRHCVNIARVISQCLCLAKV